MNMTNKDKTKGTVILGMSGGVDSSVAALLLQQQGYKVIGMFMNCGVDRKKRWPTSISWKDEEKDVRRVCKALGIELIMKDCGEGYERKVISKMFSDYSAGLTPNPDILCNNVGKFPLLYTIMKEKKADYIATGHYVRVKRKTVNGKTKAELWCGKDNNKDQSYFLTGLPHKYISKCLFPIGELKKDEVRKIASKNGFTNWNKTGSRGICYLGSIDVKDFLKSRLGTKTGDILNEEGEVIGSHLGSFLFTIGETVTESKGLTLNAQGRKKYSSKKLYVSKKKKGNQIVVSEKESRALFVKQVAIKGCKGVDTTEKILNKKFVARIRHLGEFYSGTLTKQKGKFIFTFTKPVSSVAPGQFIVLYTSKGGRVVAGGEMRLV